MDLFPMYFTFLHFGKNFLSNKSDHIQIKSDKMSVEETHYASVFGLRMVTTKLSNLSPRFPESSTMWACVLEHSTAQFKFKLCNSGGHKF